MRKVSKFVCAACLFVCGSLPLRSQIYPVPVPGGDIFKTNGGPVVFGTSFVPGVGAGFDGLNADPHTIINSDGIVAMGYTAGTATDGAGKTYNIVTDIRVYQGAYVGAKSVLGGGRTFSARAHGTFVEI